MTNPLGFKVEFHYDRTLTHSVGDGYDTLEVAMVGIVIHSTDGPPGSSFEGECIYLRDSPRASTHYLVAKDGRIERIVDTKWAAWHAGNSAWKGRTNLNQGWIGIELHHSRGDTDYPAVQLAALRWLCLELLRDKPTIKNDNIVAHRWVATPAGRKTDPTGMSDSFLNEFIHNLSTTSGDRPMKGASTISVPVALDVFYGYRSPILGEVGVQPLIAICNKYGLNFAIALAFCEHEHRLGTVGIIKKYDLKNWGACRSAEDTTLSNGVVQTELGAFASYPSWSWSLEDWCKRIVGPKYAGSGLYTVRQVLPKYAPVGDFSNNPDNYATTVLAQVDKWQKASGL
jgi:hypothetical protein